jgi:hypothetical protein
MMFARHVTLKLRPGALGIAANIFSESALPLLRQKFGFVGALMLGDDSAGLGIILILWQQAEDSERLEVEGFYREQIRKFVDVLRDPPEPKLLSVEVINFL